MTDYHTKTSADVLAFRRIRAQMKLDAKLVIDSVLNEALDEASRKFKQEFEKGGLANVTFAPGELEGMILRAAQKQLAPAPVDGEAEEITEEAATHAD